jgi:hypothetical protein
MVAANYAAQRSELAKSIGLGRGRTVAAAAKRAGFASAIGAVTTASDEARLAAAATVRPRPRPMLLAPGPHRRGGRQARLVGCRRDGTDRRREAGQAPPREIRGPARSAELPGGLAAM